ncbi:MAG: hypothetical protein JWM38_647, partial [Sphingomonas bacterium]|nr:hypothetical protein [Sphingomonas bacterium]
AELLIPLNELQYGSGIKVRTDSAGFAADRPRLAGYVARHIGVTAPDGRRWTMRITDMAVIRDSYQADLQVRLAMTPPAGASVRRFDLAYDGVIDTVANHFVLLFARSDYRGGALAGGDPQMIGGLQQGKTTARIDRGDGSGWRGFAAAIALGMRHIAEGHDHLLFLIALILPAPLIARGRRWDNYGGLPHTARRLFAVVSAFTIGHSITLIGGAFLGWSLPSRPVEVLIALSILVSAIHAWRPIFAGREALVAGGFGLVHGLAFATVIGHFMLEPWQRAQAILGFNLGIELVQLAVVACVMPALLLLARTPSYGAVRTVGAAIAGVAATAWAIERVSGQPNVVAQAIDVALGFAPWLVPVLTIAALLGLGRARTISPVPVARTAG